MRLKMNKCESAEGKKKSSDARNSASETKCKKPEMKKKKKLMKSSTKKEATTTASMARNSKLFFSLFIWFVLRSRCESATWSRALPSFLLYFFVFFASSLFGRFAFCFVRSARSFRFLSIRIYLINNKLMFVNVPR